jgi:hypothetical protein
MPEWWQKWDDISGIEATPLGFIIAHGKTLTVLSAEGVTTAPVFVSPKLCAYARWHGWKGADVKRTSEPHYDARLRDPVECAVCGCVSETGEDWIVLSGSPEACACPRCWRRYGDEMPGDDDDEDDDDGAVWRLR